MNTIDLQKAAIYRDYHDKVQGYISSKINDYHMAEDLTSDVFVKVYDKYDSFDPAKSSISTWIYTIARNTVTDYFRTRKVYEEIPETHKSSFDVEDNYCNNEMLDTLAAALETLDERERRIIILRFYHGMSLVDIAREMDISYAYVKKLQTRAFASIKNVLGNEYPI